MPENFLIHRASADDASDIAVLVGELLHEVMAATGVKSFNVDLADTTARLVDFIARDKYVVYIARTRAKQTAGCISLCESYALYAEGAFGIIPELYVRPAYRAGGLGLRLVSEAKSMGVARGWTRLEVTTPPLPQFDRTLAFYEREGFVISGGRKLKLVL